MVLVCFVILENHVTTGWSTYGWDPLKVSHHSIKFGSHRHCGSGSILVFACHMMLQDYIIKVS